MIYDLAIQCHPAQAGFAFESGSSPQGDFLNHCDLWFSHEGSRATSSFLWSYSMYYKKKMYINKDLFKEDDLWAPFTCTSGAHEDKEIQPTLTERLPE